MASAFVWMCETLNFWRPSECATCNSFHTSHTEFFVCRLYAFFPALLSFVVASLWLPFILCSCIPCGSAPFRREACAFKQSIQHADGSWRTKWIASFFALFSFHTVDMGGWCVRARKRVCLYGFNIWCAIGVDVFVWNEETNPFDERISLRSRSLWKSGNVAGRAKRERFY